jgi:ADP-L-glycero-D-manno-heptose 6-epimerase
LQRAEQEDAAQLPGEPALELRDMVSQGLIEYIPFPAQLVGKYQSFTEADTSLLRDAGCAQEFMTVERGVGAYVQDLLAARA